MTVTVNEIEVADPTDAWTRAGFSVDSGAVWRVGGVRIRLAGSGRGTGIVGWSLRGAPSHTADVDGVPTRGSTASVAAPATHPNGVTAIASLGSIGLRPRRERDAELGGRAIRQIFFRLGEVILEVVGSPAPTGDRTAPVKDAVQPGRRITTLAHRDLGMSVRTAMISPPILSA